MSKANYTAHVKLLSPLHIGTGTKLLRGIDWLPYRDGYIYFADDKVLLGAVLDRAVADGKTEMQVIRAISGLSLEELRDAGWLPDADFRTDSSIFRYRLRGEPATREIREQLKDPWGRPYLPGSSLKGALRTVLAAVAVEQMPLDLAKLDRRRAWAAQPIERDIFGADPNRDFMRMIQVGDSQPLESATLRLARAHIYPSASSTRYGRSQGLDVNLEVVMKGAEFALPVHLPLHLIRLTDKPFNTRRREELSHWESKARWLDRLPALARERTRRLLIGEVEYFQTRTDVPAVHAFYNQLANEFSALQPNQFMLPLGWGGGWHVKTLNEQLKRDKDKFERLVTQYRLNPTGERKPGDRFPKSRHLLRRTDGAPGEPLGWCLITWS